MITSEDVKKLFADWESIRPGEWSECSIFMQYGEHFNETIEISLYREPSEKENELSETYTLHVFDGDNVIACHTVK